MWLLEFVLLQMSIAVIAGLGNPGLKYRNTRHNIGFSLVDLLAARCGASWKHEARFEAEVAVALHEGRKLMLLKPQTFMNASGRSLAAALRYRKLSSESLLVIYDDLTLDLGRTKLSVNGSAGGHNGIADLLTQVGAGFARYRVGIGAKPHKEMDLADYVLSQFSKDEQTLLADCTSLFLDQIDLILESGLDLAMNTINQRKAISHERNDQK
ncbi:aminoacyl-tRNA hydrolase [Coraliomargarita sp. SDUM461004]|uniref:Peptidyl-tRNA hydrolase n=1 Tax=Thalassobacterium sedimentorum TaxID=3041258 RepID=A0ABU1AIY8_9BACT|nr:aminoacyl-tRNA hydrolase [Coraliomargarita sp. SDUM461004]MDQ8193731.1 aminoacyl-tRNA hydrolase [Coraliomargarita sp. SDUM461004]